MIQDFPDEQMCAVGIRGPLRLEDLLFQAKKANRLAPLQVVRADRIAGAQHLRSAAQHTWRAIAESRNQADRPEVEFTRYLSGKRTIKDAIHHMGVPDGAAAGIVVALGQDRIKAAEYFVGMLGLKEAPLPEATLASVHAFGITPAAIETTRAPAQDLVLEAVAAVDLARS